MTISKVPSSWDLPSLIHRGPLGCPGNAGTFMGVTLLPGHAIEGLPTSAPYLKLPLRFLHWTATGDGPA